jgi:hypothetical protein
MVLVIFSDSQNPENSTVSFLIILVPSALQIKRRPSSGMVWGRVQLTSIFITINIGMIKSVTVT